MARRKRDKFGTKKVDKDSGSTAGNAPDLVRMLPKVNHHSAWDSPEAFYKHINSLEKSQSWSDSECMEDGRGSFYGTKTWQEAVELAKNGWDEGAQTVERVRDKIKALNPTAPKVIKYAMAGSVPCVPRAVAGNILNMKNPETSLTKKKPVITLLVNICVPWFVSKDALAYRASAIACLVDEVESKGFSCEVLLCARSQGHGDFETLTTVTVKHSHQPVDIKRLAFAVGHPAMFRRFMFADWSCDDQCQQLGHGLGYCRDVKPSAELKEAAVYTIPAYDGMKHFETEELAATHGLHYIITALQGQGCPAFPQFTEAQKEDWDKTLAEIEHDEEDRIRYYDDDDDDDW